MKSKKHMRFLTIFHPKINPKSFQNASKITQNNPPGSPLERSGGLPESLKPSGSPPEASRDPPGSPQDASPEAPGPPRTLQKFKKVRNRQKEGKKSRLCSSSIVTRQNPSQKSKVVRNGRTSERSEIEPALFDSSSA